MPTAVQIDCPKKFIDLGSPCGSTERDLVGSALTRTPGPEGLDEAGWWRILRRMARRRQFSPIFQSKIGRNKGGPAVQNVPLELTFRSGKEGIYQCGQRDGSRYRCITTKSSRALRRHSSCLWMSKSSCLQRSSSRRSVFCVRSDHATPLLFLLVAKV